MAAVLVSSVLLAGCKETMEATAQHISATLGDVFGVAGPQTPVDDGTVCYAKERVDFYAAAQQANKSQEIMNLGGAISTALFDQIGRSSAGYGNAFGDMLVQNFGEALQKLQTGVKQDQAVIRNFDQAFDALYQCRVKTAKFINADLKAGRYDRPEAERRMARVLNLLKEDIEVARLTNKETQARTESFKVAADRAKEEARKAPTSAERKEKAQKAQLVEAAVQTNQKALQSGVASVEQAASVQQQQSGEFKLSWLWQLLLERLGYA